jgi:O-antigen/teichoic acid export membrane protein
MYPFTLAAIIVILVDYGFNLQLVRDVGKNTQDHHRLTCQALTIKTILTSIVVVLGLPLIILVKLFVGYRLLLVLLLFSNILNSYGMLFNLSFRGIGLFDKEVKTVFWSTMVTLLLIGCLILFGQGPEVIALALVITKAFFLIYSWIVYKRIISWAKFRYPPLSDMFAALRKGFPFAAHVALGTLYFSIDTVIIQHFLGVKNVGIYQAGLRVMVVGLVLSGVLANVYLRQMAKESADRDAFINLATRMTRHFLIVGIFGFVCMIGFPELVVKLIYGGSGYSKLNTLIPLFGVVLLLRCMANSYGIVLTVDNRQFVRMVAACLSVIISITMNIVLIPIFDLHGALYASIITHIFLISIYIVFAWRQVHSWLMERRSCLLISFAAATGLFQLLVFPDHNIVSYIVMAGAALFIGFIGVSLTEYHNLLRRFYNFASNIFSDKGSRYDHDELPPFK